MAIPAGAALTRAGAAPTDVLPSIVAGLAGVAALAWVTRSRTPAGPPGTPPDGPSRRGVLVAAGTLGLAAAAMGGAGRWLASYRSRTVVVDLPAAADPAPPFPAGLEGRVPGISPLRTPTSDFYRVDTRLTLPIVDVDGWSLTIDGDVEREVTVTFEDLLAMPLIERDITLTCVSNEVGGGYLGAARWLGVRLTDLLDLAGIDGTGADQLLSTDVDGMTISTPLAVATDGRDAMIAVGMNGRSLTREHGFPARMVVPGLYGFVSACKWITRITLTTYAEQAAYWTRRDWATDAPIKISSRIDTPRPLSTVDAGRTVIGGVAWAQHQGGIDRVEVRIDGGPWQEARLGPSAGNDYWRQWYLPWTAEPGRHALAVRATDGQGDVQTDVRTTPFPAGSSGIQEVVVNVACVAPPYCLGGVDQSAARAGPNTPHLGRRVPPELHAKGATMNTRSLRRSTSIASLALVATFGLAACGGSDSDGEASDAMADTPTSSAPADMGSDGAGTDAMDAGAATFGAGCSAIPADGAGSFNGMATEPVATAASANPLLKTLVTAVGEAGLVDTLNSADGITVFAPTDDAFAKLPPKDLKGVLADKDLLTKVLTYHVVAGQLTPEDLAGTHKTLEGEKLTVSGSGEDFTVDDGAQVLCGNIPTANATVSNRLLHDAQILVPQDRYRARSIRGAHPTRRRRRPVPRGRGARRRCRPRGRPRRGARRAAAPLGPR